MDRREVPERKRVRVEAFIRVLDLVAYVAVFLSGGYALIATPQTVVNELEGSMWLVVIWAGLLLVGGGVGFAGRLSRFWMVEVPSTVLAFFGAVIYLVVLGRFAFTSVTAAVAALFVLVAMILMARRWAELQLFGIDPDHRDYKSRLAEALRRRTQNFPRREQ